MIRKSLSFGLRTGIVLVVLCLVVSVSFLLWVMETPRSLPFLNAYIENSFNGFDNNYRTDISKTQVLWDNQKKKFDIRAIDIKLFNADGRVVGDCPEASVGFSMLSLLNGSFTPSSLTIISPTIRISTPRKPFSPATLKDFYRHSWEKMMSLSQLKKLLPFRTVILRQGAIIIDAADRSELWHIKEASVDIKLYSKKPRLVVKGDIDVAGEESHISAKALFLPDGAAEIELKADNFPVHKPLSLMPTSPLLTPLVQHNNTNLVVSGTISLQVDTEGNIQKGAFTIDDSSGKIFHPDYLKVPLYPHRLQASGIITAGGKEIRITDATIRFFRDTVVHFSALYKNTSSSPELQVSTDIENFPVNELDNFWPLPLVPKAREWVTSRISGGVVSKAVGSFVFKPEYITNKFFPKGAIDATVTFKGSNLNYFDPFPPVRNASGIATFSNEAIDIKSSSAMIENTVIEKAHVNVPYINIAGKSVLVEGTGKGNAGDILAFFSMKKMVEQGLPLNLAGLSGDAVTVLSLTIPYKTGLTLNDIDIVFNTTAHNVAIPVVVPHVDASEGRLTASMKSRKMVIEGTMLLNGNPSHIKSTVSFIPEQPLVSGSTLRTSFFPKDIALLPMEEKPQFIEGRIAAEFQIATAKKMTTVVAKMDTKDAMLIWGSAGLSKNAGESGLLDFTAQLQSEKTMIIQSFSYKSDNIIAQGNAKLTRAFALAELNLSRFSAGYTDIVLHYIRQQSGGRAIRVTGSSLDLRTVNLSDILKKSGKEKSFSLAVSLKRILMKNNEVFHNTTARMECGEVVCKTASFNTLLGNNNTANLTLKPEGTNRILTMHSDNAGALTRALNFSRKIREGELVIDAVAAIEPGKGEIFNGTLRMKDFVTINNPILSQIIAVISLPGIGLLNILNSESIAFDKLNAPFGFSQGMITLRNARASGPVLGSMMNGTINVKEGTIHLTGTAVPTVYGINNLLGKLPVLGNALMGGKNRGIIAANYKLDGPIDKASVTVNPLSILTPGFLRRLFE